jgi:hypothetical protein
MTTPLAMIVLAGLAARRTTGKQKPGPPASMSGQPPVPFVVRKAAIPVAA